MLNLGLCACLARTLQPFLFLTSSAETGSQEVAQALWEVVIPFVQLLEQLG